MTERCLLREYESGDRAAFIELNADPSVRRHMNGALSGERANELFEEILEGRNSGRFSWAVIEKSTGDFIGHVFLTDEREEGREFGFMLIQCRWGCGLATEIVQAMIDHIRTGLKLSGIFATVDTDHPASQRVLEKTGFHHLRDESDEAGPYRVYGLTSPADTSNECPSG